jgi:hypothetical protein
VHAKDEPIFCIRPGPRSRFRAVQRPTISHTYDYLLQYTHTHTRARTRPSVFYNTYRDVRVITKASHIIIYSRRCRYGNKSRTTHFGLGVVGLGLEGARRSSCVCGASNRLALFAAAVLRTLRENYFIRARPVETWRFRLTGADEAATDPETGRSWWTDEWRTRRTGNVRKYLGDSTIWPTGWSGQWFACNRKTSTNSPPSFSTVFCGNATCVSILTSLIL